MSDLEVVYGLKFSIFVGREPKQARILFRTDIEEIIFEIESEKGIWKELFSVDYVDFVEVMGKFDKIDNIFSKGLMKLEKENLNKQ